MMEYSSSEARRGKDTKKIKESQSSLLSACITLPQVNSTIFLLMNNNIRHICMYNIYPAFQTWIELADADGSSYRLNDHWISSNVLPFVSGTQMTTNATVKAHTTMYMENVAKSKSKKTIKAQHVSHQHILPLSHKICYKFSLLVCPFLAVTQTLFLIFIHTFMIIFSSRPNIHNFLQP